MICSQLSSSSADAHRPINTSSRTTTSATAFAQVHATSPHPTSSEHQNPPTSHVIPHILLLQTPSYPWHLPHRNTSSSISDPLESSSPSISRDHRPFRRACIITNSQRFHLTRHARQMVIHNSHLPPSPVLFSYLRAWMGKALTPAPAAERRPTCSPASERTLQQPIGERTGGDTVSCRSAM